MFHIMRNSNDYGTLDLVDRFMQALRTYVPLGTLNRIDYERSDDPSWDAAIRWDVGDANVVLAIEVKRTAGGVDPNRLPVRKDAAIPVLVAPFLSRSARRDLEGKGWSYWDSTGNTLLLSHEPVIAVRLEGDDKDPDPQLKPSSKLRSLKGPTASEVMVGLLQNGGRTGSIRDFAREHRLPLGTVSRVVSLLRDENFVEPTGGGPIVLTDRLEVLRRWAEDYSFKTTFRAKRYFSLTGPDLALRRFADSGIQYAVTGLRAAQEWLADSGQQAGLPVTETWVYVANLKQAERAADLTTDGRQGQILVGECDFLDRESSRRVGDIRYVAPWRTAADLVSAGGRLASVGEEVANDLIWRSLP
jgi:hypothetical protein